MKSAAAATMSKWIVTDPNADVNFAGDLLNNHGCYWPRPDYTQEYWQRAHVFAEFFSLSRSMAKAGYRRQAMFYYEASSGEAPIKEIMMHPDRVIEHVRRFSQGRDTDHLSLRRIVDVLDPERTDPVFAENRRRNTIEAAIANHCNAQGKGWDYLVTPSFRERVLHKLIEIQPLLRNITFEDAIFELHYWGPFCMWDATVGVYGGRHAQSYNAPPEKALGLALQYGSIIPLLARGGEGFDVVDIYTRPVPILDQAWEEASGFLNIVSKRVRRSDGSEIGFRFETGAALLLSRFMHDHMWRTGSRFLNKERANETVKKHYASTAEQEGFQHLKDLVLPYIAEHCSNWSLLHDIFQHDPALRGFWVEEVDTAKNRGKLKRTADIEAALCSYMPRGGYEDVEIAAKVTRRRDKKIPVPPSLQVPEQAGGLHMDAFASKNDPTIFNDRWFARLGGTASPDRSPKDDNLTRGQVFAEVAVLGAMHDGLARSDRPYTLFYLDDAGDGVRAADFRHKHQLDLGAEQGTIIDYLSGGSFAEDVAAEESAENESRVKDLCFSERNESFRKKYGIGNVMAYSDIANFAKILEGKREATDTEYAMAIAAHGEPKIGGDAIRATALRYIDTAGEMVAFRPGFLSPATCRCILEAVSAAFGKTERTHDEIAYRSRVFLDRHYYMPEALRPPPEEQDFADILIRVGLQTKQVLQPRHATPDRDLFVTMARLLHYYEMMGDPTKCNRQIVRDERTGALTEEAIVNFHKVSIKNPFFLQSFMTHQGPNFATLSDLSEQNVKSDYEKFLKDPDYQDFLRDRLDLAKWTKKPERKAKLVRMIWFYMRAHRLDVPGVDMSPAADGQKTSVIGHLLVKGVCAFDRDDTVNLPPHYQAARIWWHGLAQWKKAKVIGHALTYQVGAPALTQA